MRTIKFRGRRLDNGEWVYGSLIKNVTDKGVNLAFIVPYLPCASQAYNMWTAEMFRVNPSTVGQFTGLTDSNDKEIYEGDIVDIEIYGKEYCAKIYWNNGISAFCIKFSFENSLCYKPLHEWVMENKINVIGNIHDTPQQLNTETNETLI